MIYCEMLNKAIEIANNAHRDQVDKAGEAYILHSIRVMLSGKTEFERICGILHDVVEDSSITLNDIRNEGFSEEVIIVLDCLTRRKDETYNKFIDRIIKNKIASRIKLADLNDNMDLNRIKNPDEKDKCRIKKYHKASIKILKNNANLF